MLMQNNQMKYYHHHMCTKLNRKNMINFRAQLKTLQLRTENKTIRKLQTYLKNHNQIIQEK